MFWNTFINQSMLELCSLIFLGVFDFFWFMPRVSSCWWVPRSTFHFFLLLEFPWSVTVSCVREVDGAEELVDKTRYDEWYMIWCVAMKFLAIFDEMWFLATRPMVTVPLFFTEFSQVKKNVGVFSRSITVTKKSNSRTCTVPSSFACWL